jgi:hypothetical protein
MANSASRILPEVRVRLRRNLKKKSKEGKELLKKPAQSEIALG